jgi:hypothetical protein
MSIAYPRLWNSMTTHSGPPKMAILPMWITKREKRQMIHWSLMPMGRLLRKGNVSLSHLHWHQERPNINGSNHLQLLKLSYAKVKWRMLLKDSTWPLVKSLFVSELRCAMWIAREHHIVHGIMFINWIPRLKNAGPHIAGLGMHCSICPLIRNIWGRFAILLMMTLKCQETLLTSRDSDNGQIHFPGFGALVRQVIWMLRKCKNVCSPIHYTSFWLIHFQSIEWAGWGQGPAFSDGRKNGALWNMKCSGLSIGFNGKGINGCNDWGISKTRRGHLVSIAIVTSRWHCGVHLQIRQKQSSLHYCVILCSGNIIRSWNLRNTLNYEYSSHPMPYLIVCPIY